MRIVDNEAEDNDGDDGWEISECQTIDDIGCSSCFARFCKLLHIDIWITCHNFSNISNDKSSNKSESKASENIIVNFLVGYSVVIDEFEGVWEGWFWENVKAR